jgi:homoserine O-succinyltransferase/O-acetyltransferase
MPLLTTPDCRHGNGDIAGLDEATALRLGPEGTDARELVIGLLNNMPDAALEATERQFAGLLNAAAGEIPVRMRLFALPDVTRGEDLRRGMSARYGGIDELTNSRLDALIVTGTEPRAHQLADEPYWKSLTHVLEWAQENTLSAVWSCHAAHAAVLHLDGIERHRLDEKRFGLFECVRLASHTLLTGVPDRIRIAHSRCNDLHEEDLAACGYTILTRSPEAGVDAFAKQGRSLLVFFQGHPEYDQRALLREYRRDIGRFLRAERNSYPAMPRGYFDPVAADALTRFQERALLERDERLLDSFPGAFVESRLTPMTRASAVRLYANWLSYLSARRHQMQTFRLSGMTQRVLRKGAWRRQVR